MVRPDYSGGGFVNLIASITAARGGAPRHAPLAALPPATLERAENLVLLIVDGLGDGYLREHGGRGAISAVFPSTTASAITTSFTGATPLEHGLTGWFTYFSETACVAAPLPFERRGDRRLLALSPEALFAEPSLFDGVASRVIVVSWRGIIDSPYNRHHCGRAERLAYDDLAGLVAQTVAAVKSGRGRKLVYAYWPEFDRLAHQHGVASAEVQAQFEAIDAAFGGLLARLAATDTVVVATADHGFLDCPLEDAVELPAALAAQLRFPLCGERRVAFCHVHEPQRFAREAAAFLGTRAEVRPSRELAAEGWFGDGRPHARFAERIGDVALLMRGRATVKDWVAGESRHLHIGNHGGTSEDEMRIPLVVAQP
ncbi:MAG TPA: alkaline phosphatase family protein [Burkholderiales bacterium]|nr:alkaline phosphatase family protein [Burkholderiales bacterium]